MARERRRPSRLRWTALACVGASAGLGLGLLAALALLPSSRCPDGRSRCVVKWVASAATSDSTVRAPLLPASVERDAGAAPVDALAEPKPACPAVETDARVWFASPEDDLAAAGEMLIGDTEMFGLDYDVADALRCGDRSADNPPGACALPSGGPLRVGGFTFCTARHTTGHEWDGMYSHDETVLIARPSPRGLQVVHAIPQWKEDVPDCFTELLHQRYAIRDLDGDGRTELCVESIHEVGDGLFDVMDAERWRPKRRERRLRAYRVHPTRGRLLRAEALDARCPRSKGYEPFAPHETVGDSVAWRANVQGGKLCPASCPRPLRDMCGNVHFSRRDRR